MAAMVVMLLLGLLQLAVSGLAQSPPPGTLETDNVESAGTGCPPGSLELDISPDRIPSYGFKTFTVFTPGGPADRLKNCQVSVDLRYPNGSTFALGTATFRVSAQLEEGVTGSLAASYYFSSTRGTARSSRSLPPPVEGDILRNLCLCTVWQSVGDALYQFRGNSTASILAE
ncbi:hypothetical protein CBR_g49166 [Chara braunii]|uniref:Pherophorin domain-containing protein n=1 Tax=Chara braunii TaxID=69332 RepID=A0A388M4F2_CHABU|nr:hypothetical protein CBR_g49166 [Chara braunii]|eukprot:GBG89375.1 hypothetical protein CBR_g49166 [Chara braunii]